MNISFDVFNEHPELMEGISTDEHIFYTSYLKFFADKLQPLKQEIDKEEDDDEDGARFTEINILTEGRGPATFWGYSKELRLRMEGCFKKEDFEQYEADLLRLRSEWQN